MGFARNPSTTISAVIAHSRNSSGAEYSGAFTIYLRCHPAYERCDAQIEILLRLETLSVPV